MTENNLGSSTSIEFLLLCHMQPPPFKHSLPNSSSRDSDLVVAGVAHAQAYFFTYLVIFIVFWTLYIKSIVEKRIYIFFVLFSENENLFLCLKVMVEGSNSWVWVRLQF